MRNFGRSVTVMIDGAAFSSQDFTIEGTVPFDADAVPNEAEIKIWNLSPQTISRFKRNGTLIVNAGYVGDTGTILHGFISNVLTEDDGADWVTTIHVLDSDDISKREVKSIAYAPKTLASYILRQMIGQLGLPLANMTLVRDYRYEEGYTADGLVTDIVQKVAEDCQTAVYINKGRIFAQSIRAGRELFTLSPETGLIGTPKSFDDGHVAGLNVTSQLQYRITTASVLDVVSKGKTTRCYVRSGSHKFSMSGDFVTEVECVL
ncbi:hypothetical protein SAMN02799624_04545 [Paenibacillus sp. UNC496MF]|uniref:phage protein n=1 Tax=Paenibacillus sp. UNC496MF TaxID=1502753 RepID=UPI0008EA8901|nr:hypothetical protein [Paenibacillus sp. UNC496MF]SFJ44435.1 hypothetical protein SAMN02799624_04545 [Paenibacillus sp. UNC496MF]